MNELQDTAKVAMEKSLDALVTEFSKIRTGRANVSILDSVKVDYYGSPTPLSQVAALSCPDAKSFLISPWEPSILKQIEQAIVTSNLGMAPMNDGKAIRLRVPDLTEERRKDIAKSVKKVAEEARVSIRMKRKDANDTLKKQLKDKEISEDECKKFQDEIQKATDNFIKRIDQLAEEKEKEILTV